MALKMWVAENPGERAVAEYGGGGLHCLLGLLQGGVCVPEGDANAGLDGVADDLVGAWEFRGDGEKFDVTPGGLLEAIEERDGRRLEQCGGVDAAFALGKEGAFEVDAERPGFVGGRGGLDDASRGGPGRGGWDRWRRWRSWEGSGRHPCVARKRWSFATPAGVADMTSWPAPPWMWMSKKVGVRMAVERMEGSVEMSSIRPPGPMVMAG